MEERLTTDQAVAGSSPATDAFVHEEQKDVPLVGLEPTIFGLGSQRLIH